MAGQQINSSLLCAVLVNQRMHVGIRKWMLTSEAGDVPKTAMVLLVTQSGLANLQIKFQL